MSFLHSRLWKQNGGQCDWAYGEVNDLGGPAIPGISTHKKSNIFIMAVYMDHRYSNETEELTKTFMMLLN